MRGIEFITGHNPAYNSYKRKRPLCCNPKKVCYDEVTKYLVLTWVNFGVFNTKITKVTPLEKISLGSVMH